MNPPSNTGSFGAALGGISPELAAAVQARSGQAPASSQVSQSAPSANPQLQAPMPPTAQSPMPSTAGMAPSASGAPSGLPFDSSEAKIIIQTLGNRLKSLSRLQGA